MWCDTLKFLNHEIDLFELIGRNDGQLIDEEHAHLLKILLQSRISENHLKLGSFGIFMEAVKKNGHKNILAVGIGHGMLEYLLQVALPEDTKVYACDFEKILLDKAANFFPEMTVSPSDLLKDGIMSLKHELNAEFDLIVFFGSACVMKDMQLIALFHELKSIGVKQIIDFHGEYMDLRVPINSNASMRNLFNRPTAHCKGKFHGYSGNRGDLSGMYRKSNWKILEEISAPGYKCVGVLG